MQKKKNRKKRHHLHEVSLLPLWLILQEKIANISQNWEVFS